MFDIMEVVPKSTARMVLYVSRTTLVHLQERNLAKKRVQLRVKITRRTPRRLLEKTRTEDMENDEGGWLRRDDRGQALDIKEVMMEGRTRW